MRHVTMQYRYNDRLRAFQINGTYLGSLCNLLTSGFPHFRAHRLCIVLRYQLKGECSAGRVKTIQFVETI